MLHPYFENGLWGYIDNQGRVVVKPQFDGARDFFEDRAAVWTRDKSGYIRPDGSWAVVLPRGAFPTRRFSERRAWFRQDDGLFGCVDPEGNIVILPSYDWAEEFSEGLAVVNTGLRKDFQVEAKEEERYGFIDRAGQVALPLPYVYAGRFGNGLAPTRRPGERHYEYIDRTGKIVFSLEGLRPDPRCHVRSASAFSDGRVTVWFDGNLPARQFAVFLDTTGRRIVPHTYEGASTFSEGLALVLIRSKVGYVDRGGHVVIPPKFDEGGDFHEGLCRVRVGMAWQYIDRQGTVVARGGPADADAWNDAEDFHGGLARVHLGGEFVVETMNGPAWWQGGKWCYIDRRGTIVAVCRLDGEQPIEPLFGKEQPAPIP